jgi:hypothetical protein
MFNLALKIMIWIFSIMVNAVATQQLYEHLFTKLQKSFFNSDIDHVTFIHKSKSIAYFCTSIFVILLLLTYILTTLIN